MSYMTYMTHETEIFNMGEESDTMYDEGDDVETTDEDTEEDWKEDDGLEEEGNEETM